MARVFTIGFTKTTAEQFFRRLRDSGVRRVLDVRLNSTSQLAGFAKSADLAFFLQSLAGIDYRQEPLLAPTALMLTTYRKQKKGWDDYESAFLALLAERGVENALDTETFDNACLLCSEFLPHHCHRRLVCDYLNAKWNAALTVQHL